MMMNKDIETEFKTVYDEGEVVAENSYHQPDKAKRCKCTNTTKKGAYREVVVEYNNKKYFYLHQNLIMVKLSPSKFMISNAGYKTELTKRTLNKMLPSEFKIKQKDKEWYINIGNTTLDFYNGMIIDINADYEKN